jgi:tetratricopeptide (TPR) repeat protein
MPTVADLPTAFPAPHAAVVLALVVVLGLGLVAILLGVWLLLGPGPRRSRAYHRAQRLLHQGNWEEALAIVGELKQGRLSVQWQGRLRSAEGECHHAAGDAALRDKRYEDSLAHYQTAAGLLDLDPAALRDRVLEAMLAEARRLFATGSEKDLTAGQALLARALLLQSPCPEASFWQGLCFVRQGQLDQAFAALALAHEGASPRFVDPPLYLGTLHLRQGRPQEALRYLSEANRVEGGCPLVTWQLGMAMVAAGTDSRITVPALQRACGPRGLGLWAGDPRAATRLWVEAFPETRSYVRRLALKHAYHCPVLGNDVGAMLRQGQLALAQAHYRLNNFQEAADLIGKLLEESPPTPPLLRGLGLALARLGRYDQAYKHLRTAFDQEEPKTPQTAGYLALCGALGKPAQAEDKPRNVAWAIRLLARFDIPGDPEWADLMSRVFAEARVINLPVAVEDQGRLCDVLASVEATDTAAAAAYHHLAATSPEAVRPVHAWLYCRAAQQHGFNGERDLDLFGLAFRDEPAARTFYAGRSWDLDEVEYVYLARAAAARPGAFPPELGPDFSARGATRLLARSQRQESAGHLDSAFATAEVLLRLAPTNPVAHDRLAYLHYQRGDITATAALLSGWHRLEPNNPLPLCRLAVVEHQRGNADGRRQAVGRALDVARPPARADVAFLGARLALQASAVRRPAEGNGEPAALPADVEEARHLLQQCLKDDPDHVDALWRLAAVRAVAGDQEGLAAQSAVMHRPDVRDSRFQYLAAVCHLAAGDYGRALEAAGLSAADPALAADSHYLMGWAHLHRRDRAAAVASLRQAAAAADSPSADHARALLGRLCFTDGAADEAVECWTAVTPARRREWQLEEALRSTVFLTGLQAYLDGRFEQASERFREAGTLGLRERRLGPLMFLALFRAGQALLFGGS